MLLNAALKEYLLECELRNYTEKTIKGYRNSIELLVNYLQQNGITDAAEVLPSHIKQFLTNLQRAGRKPSYINGLHKAFRAWFKYLQEEEYISANPMNKIGWAKEEKIVIKTFTPAEVQAMLNAYPEKEYMDVRNKTILAYTIIEIISGVGSGKNYWVETLAKQGKRILLITSRKITADAQAQKLGCSRWIDLEDLWIDDTLMQSPPHQVVVTNASIEQFIKTRYKKDDMIFRITAYSIYSLK